MNLDLILLTKKYHELQAEHAKWVEAAAHVGIDCPGAMQQAVHMADAACFALNLRYSETSPNDIKAAIGSLISHMEERNG